MKIKALPRQEYRDILQKLDPKLSPTDDGYAAAVVLLAAAKKGTLARDIAREAKYPYQLVCRFVRNYRAGGVFHQGKVRAEDWHDEETGGVGFWLDVCVGQGLVKKTFAKGRPKKTASGAARAE